MIAVASIEERPSPNLSDTSSQEGIDNVDCLAHSPFLIRVLSCIVQSPG